MGDYPGAYEQYKTAVQIKPDHLDALRLLGATALQLGHLPEARAAMEAARRLDPQNPNIIAAFRILEQTEQQRAKGATPPSAPPITPPPASTAPPPSQPTPAPQSRPAH
jgi:cytochrome c-type biogenesis protein CcmH/NrfG